MLDSEITRCWGNPREIQMKFPSRYVNLLAQVMRSDCCSPFGIKIEDVYLLCVGGVKVACTCGWKYTNVFRCYTGTYFSVYDSVGFFWNSLTLYLMVLVTVQWDLFHEQSGAKHSNHRQGQKPKSPFFRMLLFKCKFSCLICQPPFRQLLSRAESSASFTLGSFSW